MRLFVLGPRVIDPVTGVLKHLYAPPVIIPLLAVIAAAHAWLYFVHGVSVSFVEVLSSPARLLVVLVTMVLAGVFHEFGHASALRYGGGRVRGMGAGFYLIYPAVYTDTTDTYRLGRWAKVRTDLGGFYFYLIFALGIMGLYLATGREFLLFVVLLINLDIFYQCLPFVRLDGYWALSSLTGIPDLLSYMNPFLRGEADIPAAKGGKLPALKPWVKTVFIAYLCLTIPALIILLLLFITRAPWMLGVVWDTYRRRGADLYDAVNAGDFVGVVLYTLQICFLAFLAFGILYMLYNLGRQVVGMVRGWGRQRRRVV
jgi:putative peptide zinc metalloprotease protein